MLVSNKWLNAYRVAQGGFAAPFLSCGLSPLTYGMTVPDMRFFFSAMLVEVPDEPVFLESYLRSSFRLTVTLLLRLPGWATSSRHLRVSSSTTSAVLLRCCQTVDVLPSQYLDRVSAVSPRQVHPIQTTPKTVDVPQSQFLDRLVDVPVAIRTRSCICRVAKTGACDSGSTDNR